jgi:hypothetical protein
MGGIVACIALGILADSVTDIFPAIGRKRRLRIVCGILEDSGVPQSEYATTIGNSDKLFQFVDNGTGPLVDATYADIAREFKVIDVCREFYNPSILAPYKREVEKRIGYALAKGGRQVSRDRGRASDKTGKGTNNTRTYGFASLERGKRKSGDIRSRIVREFECTMGTELDDIRQSVYCELLAFMQSPAYAQVGSTILPKDIALVVNKVVNSRTKTVYKQGSILANKYIPEKGRELEAAQVYDSPMIAIGQYERKADDIIREELGTGTLADAIRWLVNTGLQPKTFQGLDPQESGISQVEKERRADIFTNWERRRKENPYHVPIAKASELFGLTPQQVYRGLGKLETVISGYNADESDPIRFAPARRPLSA